MIPSTLLLCALAAPSAPACTLQPSAPQDAAYDKRLEDAGDDIERLWELVIWCESTEREKESRKVLRKIIRVEPNHRRAREKLGHLPYDDKWFPSQKKLDEYKLEKDTKDAKSKGLVRFKGSWVEPADVPFLKRGLVRDNIGVWVTKEELKKSNAGYMRQDLQWIAPDEIPNISKGLWKCGDDWLPIADADVFHRDIPRWWEIPSENVVALSTCDREVTTRAIREMERSIVDLERIYGTSTAGPIRVAVLRNAEQYDRFAGGVAEVSHPKTDSSGLAPNHHAFFTDGWIDEEQRQFLGMGAGVWDDSSDVKMRFGVCAVRHATGQSFAEAIDPSYEALEKMRKARQKRGKPLVDDKWVSEFYSEKKIPRWFRYGAASYVERYYHDNFVETGGDPWWTRKWSCGDIEGGWGLSAIPDIFAFDLENAGERSTHLINEAGLLVAFALDGDCKPVKAAHEDLKEAFAAREDPSNAFKKLEKALAQNEAALRQFAGM